MLNKKQYELIKTGLETDGQGKEVIHSFGDDFLYEAVRLCANQERDKLEEEFRIYKRFRKMLESYVTYDISYEIGRADGISITLECLARTMLDQNDFNKRMEAEYQRENIRKILKYLYDNPHTQHKTLVNATKLKPNYLSQLLRELEGYGCVVRYGIDRRSFFELSLDGQAFMRTKLTKKRLECYAEHLLVREKQKVKDNIRVIECRNTYSAVRTDVEDTHSKIGLLDEYMNLAQGERWRRA